MKKAVALLLLLSICLGMTGCIREESGTRSTTAPTASSPDRVIEIGKDALPCTEEELYRQLFDSSNAVHLDLDMPQEELAKLQADFEANKKSPIYRRADLTVTVTQGDETVAYRIPDVGVRMKGNTSRVDFYSPEEGIYNAIHLKLDFQETFDDEACYGKEAQVWESDEARSARKDRTFATLEKLELRWNKCYDSTYLKESYAYQVYQEYGVMAPQVSLCSLQWSGLHMGVYTLNEPVDKVFLEKRLPEAALGGDLYKLGWTYTGANFTKAESIGVEDELNNEFYAYDLKTNKKTSDHGALIRLIEGLNSGDLTKNGFAELVELENFLYFAAVSWFLGNPDDLRNNYNNCYLYFRADTGKAMLIPYDYDRCLGVTYEWDPYGDGMVSQEPFSDRCANGTQQSPLFLHSVVKGGFYVEEYTRILEEVAESSLWSPETFSDFFAQAEGLYGADARPGKEFANGNLRDWGFALEGAENLSFAQYIQGKQQTLRRALEALVNAPTHCIRADFNGWSSQSQWAMTEENGLQVIVFQRGEDFRFKVYAEETGNWYGAECLAPDAQVAYTTDSHTNICLKAGTYRVTFDPETTLLTVEKL